MKHDPDKYRCDLDCANADLSRSIDLQAARMREERRAFERAGDEGWSAFQAALWWLLALLAWAVFLAGALSAEEADPEPFHLAGEYDATWNGQKGVVKFDHGGAYTWKEASGTTWVGMWSLQGRTLSVSERRKSAKGPFHHFWDMTLDRALTGEATSDSWRIKVTFRKRPR